MHSRSSAGRSRLGSCMCSERFPRLAFVATHLGAWKDWDLVAQHLPGARLWIDTAYSLEFLPRRKRHGS